MAHHEVVENNVKKELSYSLIGVLAFLGVVLLILISAIVRPAGNHVDVAKLNAEVLMDKSIALPTIKEQKKIGAFFQKFDSLITLHQCKVEKLKILKKSMLEKMFV